MSEKRDYYEVLGIERNAGADDIKRAYRKLAMQYHPDRNPDDPDAERKFKEAAEAYDILGDAQKRGQYDQFGHAAFSGGAAGGQRFSNLEDIFDAFGDIFGGGGGGGFFGDLFGGGRRRQRGPRRGRDLKIVLEMTLEEIDSGVERTISLKRHEHCDSCNGNGGKDGAAPTTCPTCAGAGRVQRTQGFFAVQTACPTCQGRGQAISDPCTVCSGSGRKTVESEVVIQVPAGIEDGMRIRVSGAGDTGDPGAPRGDLYCIVREAEHAVFQRGGADLITEIPFGFSQLALGDRVEIPTLRGKADMNIPAGTQPGRVFRMRGQGLPHLEGSGRGDQLVRVFVEVPKKLTDRQKDLLREFAEIEGESTGSRTILERITDYFNG
ncbi:molecular chaperone DnaJ [Engelhardtia mirabilis]|uniref:Chaperone protein DnaJ n=1 Tax=Engelhardtia mirabilis TaxID=2528011 RepID=A0A518BM71_9BACT|nr:Chaperone protein DnaJ [Planctomycetes bacterium Pla133]QDV02405.1 Chaperone protein DnaJ [Planctomycetes bacterium Pla86]